MNKSWKNLWEQKHSYLKDNYDEDKKAQGTKKVALK